MLLAGGAEGKGGLYIADILLILMWKRREGESVHPKSYVVYPILVWRLVYDLGLVQGIERLRATRS